MKTVNIPDRISVFIVENEDEIKHTDDITIFRIKYDSTQPITNTTKRIKEIQVLNKLLKIKPSSTLEYILNHGWVCQEMLNKKWFYLVLIDNTKDNKQWAIEYKKLLLNVFSLFKEDIMLVSVPMDKTENKRILEKEFKAFQRILKTV